MLLQYSLECCCCLPNEIENFVLGKLQHMLWENQPGGQVVFLKNHLKIQTTMWNCYPATELQWWQQVPEDATIWGDWPQDVTSVENVTEDESGIVIKLFSQEKQWIARLCPLDVGQDASRIVRHNDWNVALQGCDILMPVAGWSTDTSDRILIYPQYEVVAKNEILDNMQSIISSMDTK